MPDTTTRIVSYELLTLLLLYSRGGHFERDILGALERLLHQKITKPAVHAVVVRLRHKKLIKPLRAMPRRRGPRYYFEVTPAGKKTCKEFRRVITILRKSGAWK